MSRFTHLSTGQADIWITMITFYCLIYFLPCDTHLCAFEHQGDRTLSLLVENCGRVNYGKALDEQRKGILPSNISAIHWFVAFIPNQSFESIITNLALLIYFRAYFCLLLYYRCCGRHCVESNPFERIQHLLFRYEARLYKKVGLQNITFHLVKMAGLPDC